MATQSEHPVDPELIAHEKTYHAFNMLIRWSMVHLAWLILFLTLWFATPAGFWGGLAAGVLAFIVGYLLVIRREARQPLDPWAIGR